MTTKQIQHLLAYLGYYKADCDGDFGPLTRQAVVDFQRAFGGLDPDGDPGPLTQKALTHAVAYGMPTQEETAGESPAVESFWDEIEYFTREEFRCQCGGKYCDGFPAEPHETTVRYADAIRKRIGKPITVNSGLRCPTWNSIQGGVSNSNHMSGGAADLGKPSGVTVAQMAAIAEEVMGSTGGIGIYDWGIHIDDGKYSRWNG